jgi:hypothetical protein
MTLCGHAQEIRVRFGTPETGVAGAASCHHAAAGVAVRPAAQHARPLHRAGRALAAAAARRPFYFAYAPANVAVKNVIGPGITEPLPTVVVQPAILWEDVAYTS